MSKSKFALTGALGVIVIFCLAIGVTQWEAIKTANPTMSFVDLSSSVGSKVVEAGQNVVSTTKTISLYFSHIASDFTTIFSGGDWSNTFLVASFKWWVNTFSEWLSTWWTDMWEHLLDSIKSGSGLRVTIPLIPFKWF
jgi:hypothetical protein